MARQRNTFGIFRYLGRDSAPELIEKFADQKSALPRLAALRGAPPDYTIVVLPLGKNDEGLLPP